MPQNQPPQAPTEQAEAPTEHAEAPTEQAEAQRVSLRQMLPMMLLSFLSMGIFCNLDRIVPSRTSQNGDPLCAILETAVRIMFVVLIKHVLIEALANRHRWPILGPISSRCCHAWNWLLRQPSPAIVVLPWLLTVSSFCLHPLTDLLFYDRCDPPTPPPSDTQGFGILSALADTEAL